MGHPEVVGTEGSGNDAECHTMPERLVRRGAGDGFGLAVFAPRCMRLLFRGRLSSYGDKETGPVNDKPPSILGGVGIAQHLNAQLPLSLTFTDDQGKQVELGSYFGRKPAILALVNYSAPCSARRKLNGLTGALQMVDEAPGKDFNVIVVSIDPSEGTDLAAAKKRSYVKRYGHPETAAGWHFMTGTQANIDALTKAVGFGYVKDSRPMES